MLEILAIWQLAVHIGKEATRKGLKKGRYQLMAVLLWLIAEFTGGVLGAAIFGESGPIWLTYVLALIFAVISAGISFLVMRLLPGQDPSISIEEPSGLNTFGRSGWIPLLVILLAFFCLCVVFGVAVIMQAGSMLQ